MTLMRSCTPGTPWGILVKSSFPMAFCLVVKGRWSDVTTFRVSLQQQKQVYVTFWSNLLFTGWMGAFLCIKQSHSELTYSVLWNPPSQQAEQEVGCVGVQPQGRHSDIGSSMGPVLVVVLQPIYNSMGSGGLAMHHFTYIHNRNALLYVLYCN